MREINFRAWYRGKYHYDVTKTKIVHHEMSGHGGEAQGFDYWLKYAEVEQFTDLYDKNGKEIYEGDIVEAYRYTFSIPGTGEQKRVSGRGVMIWLNCGFILEALTKKDSLIHGLVPYKADMEVIGNIHENPELLEREA